MSELNYASTLAALDQAYADASAGSGSIPVGRYTAMIREAKIVARTNGNLALSAFTSYGLTPNGLPFLKGFLQMIQLPLDRLSQLEQVLPQFRGRRCAISVQTDKRDPQYTRTYVDRYLGMGDLGQLQDGPRQAADSQGFTPADDDGDLPF